MDSASIKPMTAAGYERYRRYLSAAGAQTSEWSDLTPLEQGGWACAVKFVEDNVSIGRSTGIQDPILRVERPYIPTIEVFGQTHNLLHPLQNTPETKKKISDFADKYTALRGIPNDQITDGQRRDMYTDMGKMLRIFIPTLPPSDLELLDDSDRYRMIGACFAAYEDVFARMQQRNAANPTEPASAAMYVIVDKA